MQNCFKLVYVIIYVQRDAFHEAIDEYLLMQNCIRIGMNYISGNSTTIYVICIYRKKTPTTKNVINIPVELNAIAPIAQPDSSRKYCSGMSWQYCL